MAQLLHVGHMQKNQRAYPSDLTDEEWKLVEPLFREFRMRNCSQPKRRLLDAVLYLLDTGCKWRSLPHDFPPYTTVSSFYHRAIESGLWDALLAKIVRLARLQQGREPEPTYAVIDSQSVKTVYASEGRGLDGGKKVKGHKRHIVTDTLGHLLGVYVHPANIHDTKAGYFPALEAVTAYPTIVGFCADAGYRKTFEEEVATFLGRAVDIVQRSATKAWEIQPVRWVVERTFAWLNGFRRLSKDFEMKLESSVTMIKLAHIVVLLRRLTKKRL